MSENYEMVVFSGCSNIRQGASIGGSAGKRKLNKDGGGGSDPTGTLLLPQQQQQQQTWHGRMLLLLHTAKVAQTEKCVGA